MSAGIYFMNFAQLQVYECGAQFVSLLAYPTDDAQDNQRAALHASLCSFWLKHVCWRKRSEIDPIPMKPIYAFRSDDRIAHDMKTLQRRFRDRMVAARMAVPFLQEVELGHAPKLPPSVTRLSLNQMAAFVADEVGQSEPTNVKRRIWAPSRPVVHLAVAALIAEADHGRMGVNLTMEDLLSNRPLIEMILEEAKRNEERIGKPSKLGIDPESLIKLRLS